jgi:hypothetical protein
MRALADGFDLGPIQGSRDHLKDETKKSAVNPHIGGGAFGLTFGGADSHATNRGVRERFICDRKGHRGEKACGCLWTLWYEMSTEGYCLFSYPHQEHEKQIPKLDSAGLQIGTSLVTAHLLIQPDHIAELRTTATGRQIPSELRELALVLSKICTPAQIHKGLQIEARRRNLDPNGWNYDDVLRQYPADVSVEKDFDATGLIELLEKREQDHNLRYFARAGKAGHLNKIFIELEDARVDYSKCGKLNVLLFDPTHGTNRYGLKLCFFVTVGGTGQTIILAVCLIQHEDPADIEWALRCFHEVFKVAPGVFKTDGAAAIAAAFRACSDIWPLSKHQLCIWHLSKNFYEHIRPVLCTSPDHWKTAYTWFWRIMKVSDSQFADENQCHNDLDDDEHVPDNTIVTFGTQWRQLVEFVQTHGSGSTLELAIIWLESLYENRHKWAACYTYAVILWGINSTQRSEAANSAIKSGRQMGGFSLVKCVSSAVDYNSDARYRKEEDAVRRRLKQVGSSALNSELIRSLHGAVTPYGLDLIAAQMAQIMRYSAYICGDDDVDEHNNRYFWVAAETDNELDSNALELDPETGRIANFADDNDLGIGEGGMKLMLNFRHHTSVNVCSCQLKDHPCRHILYLRHCESTQKKEGLPLISLVGIKWHEIDKVTAKKMVQRLNTAPLQSSTYRAPRMQILPRKERYSRLMDELRPLALLGAESMESMNTVLAEIQSVALSLSTMNFNQMEGTSSATQNATETVDTSARAGQQSSASTGTGPAKGLVNDTKNLLATLGERFVIAKASVPENALAPRSSAGAKLVGLPLAYKWNGKNRSGWMTGRIQRQYDCDDSGNTDLGKLTALLESDVDSEESGSSDDEDMFGEEDDDENTTDWSSAVDSNFVADWSDGFRCPVKLEMALLVNGGVLLANQLINSWCLLSEKPLSDNVAELSRQGQLHNPEPKGSKGRPASARKKNQHGPGSGRKRKKN